MRVTEVSHTGRLVGAPPALDGACQMSDDANGCDQASEEQPVIVSRPSTGMRREGGVARGKESTDDQPDAVG